MIFRIAGTDETFEFAPRAVVIAGFTGANRAAVDDHIRELAAEGIEAPATVPAFYVLPAHLLTAEPSIDVSTPETSGEAEPVLLCAPDGWFVAVGSDHTARDLERIDIGESKGACPKAVSYEVWPYDEVSENWERLLLRSWVTRDGEKVPYQEATLAELMPVGEVLEKLERTVGESAEGMAVFLGTVPLLTASFVFSETFRGELADPASGKRLDCDYVVKYEKEAPR